MPLDSNRLLPGTSLDWTEYVAVVISIVVSIGLSFWTYRATKHDNYFGSRVPYSTLAMSIIASSSSGVSLLGKPAEAYENGTKFYALQIVTFLLSTFVASELLLPTLHQMDCASLYDYFELRFHKCVRQIVTTIFTLTRVCHTSVMILPPAIALNQLSGIDTNVCVASLALITVFYTMLGGFKGVVWTDAIQGIVMFASMITLGAVSIYESGGFARFLRVSYENDRLSVSGPTVDPTDRISVWAYLSFTYSVATVSLNQPTYQRIKCASSLGKAKMLLWLQCFGMIFFATSSVVFGLSIYAYYYGCDPKEAKIVKSYSQLVVYWVSSVGSRMRGFRGVYLAGIVCASISSISTNLNSLACLFESQLFFRRKPQDQSRRRLFYQRFFTTAFGIVVTVVALTMKDSASLIELTYLSLSSDGIIAGLFFLGILVVPAEERGALAGGLITLISIFSLSFFRIITPIDKVFHVSHYMRTDQCPFNVSNNGLKQIGPTESSNAAYLLRLSPFSMGPLAVLSTIAIGVTVSLALPARQRRSYNTKLYSKLVHKFLPRDSLEQPVQLGPLLQNGQSLSS